MVGNDRRTAIVYPWLTRRGSPALSYRVISASLSLRRGLVPGTSLDRRAPRLRPVHAGNRITLFNTLSSVTYLLVRRYFHDVVAST